MVTVFVWDMDVMNIKVGHASMQVDTDHGSTYISWWPGSFPIRDVSPIRNRNHEADKSGEAAKGEYSKNPDHTILIHNLDEKAILEWWSSFGLVFNGVELQGPLQAYNILAQNCSTVVATGLKIGAGDRLKEAGVSESVIWRPQSVLDFAIKIAGYFNKSV